MEILVNSELRGGNVMQQRILRGMSFMAVAALVGAYPAQAQNQGGVPAEFKPTIEQKVDARSSPAKATSDDDSTLTGKGYVQIGTISASQPGKKANAAATEELESAILRKAAEAGGDVVRFSKEGTLEVTDVPTGRTKTKRKCEEFKTNSITTGQNCTPSCHTDSAGGTMCINTLCSPKTMDVTVCVRWGEAEETPVTKRENGLVSEGNVWRYDPKLAADIARAAEAAREAARKKDDFIGVLGTGDITGIGKLLNDDPGLVAIKGENDETPLHWAAKNGRQDVAELLLTKGAHVNARNGYDETPLHLAAFRGDRAMAELLISKGADVNAEKLLGETPLYQAALFNHKDVVELLLSKGAKVDAKTLKDADFRVKELLLNDPYASPEAREAARKAEAADKAFGPLRVMLSKGQDAEAELAVAHGADVNARDNDGWTHLHWAASAASDTGTRKRVEFLLAHGADVNARDNAGSTPLHDAADWGNKEVAELLLAHGADVNARDHNGYTPLLEAAYSELSGQKELVAKLLLAHGADVNATANNGWTPLRWAEYRKNEAIVDLLRQHGGHE
jgi:ankyrin repeat protein